MAAVVGVEVIGDRARVADIWPRVADVYQCGEVSPGVLEVTDMRTDVTYEQLREGLAAELDRVASDWREHLAFIN